MYLFDSLTFLKRFIYNPKSVGSVIPSSPYLGKKVAKIVDGLEKLDIIELGAGTGALTKYIQDKNPLLIEYEADLAKILKDRYPNLTTINNDAIIELSRLDKEVGIVLSIPLVNNPIKDELVSIINKKYLEGKIKWLVMYTYSFQNQLAGSSFIYQKRESYVALNIPPANVWLYY